MNTSVNSLRRAGLDLRIDNNSPSDLSAPEVAPSSAPVKGSERSPYGEIHRVSWTQVADTYVSVVIPVERKVPPGFYDIVIRNDVPALLASNFLSDSLHQLPMTEYKTIMEELDRFNEAEENYKRLGLIYKRGFLLYGPQGSGKTSLLQLATRFFIEKQNAIVLNVEDPGWASSICKSLRDSGNNNLIVTLMEDFDALSQRNSTSQWLSFLDGENQVNRIVHFATTNYLERIEPRFSERPSRFDTVVCVGMPSVAARKFYLKQLDATLSEDEVEDFVQATENMTLTFLKELVVLTRGMGFSLEEGVARLNLFKARRKEVQAIEKKNTVGFHN